MHDKSDALALLCSFPRTCAGIAARCVVLSMLVLCCELTDITLLIECNCASIPWTAVQASGWSVPMCRWVLILLTLSHQTCNKYVLHFAILSEMQG